MFSNRSVRVQPSAPAIEYGGSPEALIVSAAATISSNVAGGSTPAVSYVATLYQPSDLLLALNRKP